MLVDLGCTRCLISETVATSMGMRLQRLGRPIRFEQMDGSLLGCQPATHVTEKVTMELGQHRERIHFVVVPKITEEVILG